MHFGAPVVADHTRMQLVMHEWSKMNCLGNAGRVFASVSEAGRAATILRADADFSSVILGTANSRPNVGL